MSTKGKVALAIAAISGVIIAIVAIVKTLNKDSDATKAIESE